MAAPSTTVWGSTVGGYGRLGIYVKLTSTATQTTRHTEIWFWSKYSVSDSSNTLYYNDNATSATTSQGSKTIKTTVDSGDGWSTSNQVKLSEYDYTFTRGTGAFTQNVAAKLTGVDRVGGTMTCTTSYTIPALAKYTISYNANGGSGAPGNQTKYYGKNLTLSSTKPTRTGYTFIGWGSSASSTSPVNRPGGTYTGNANYTYYAIWEKTIWLYYERGGGSPYISTQGARLYNATTSSTLTISTTKLERTGYTFLGWSTSSSATSASYQPGGSITISSDTTLYAVWKINTYTVSYNANGGSGAPGGQTKNHGATLTLSSTKPTRTGYDFKGWGTSPSGSAVYAAGGSYKNNVSVTLYAIWEIKTYNVSYNANGGSGAPSAQVKTYGQDLTLSSTEPTRKGYTFLGWGRSATTTTISYQPGWTYKENEAVTLYAIWQVNTYKISYDANGGTGAPSSHNKTYGVETKISTVVPTRKGYRFLGWGRSADTTHVSYQPGWSYKEDEPVALYAIWERLGIAKINIDGTWKQGRIWVNQNGTWKTGLIYINVNGNWKQGGA